ncbi:PD40 domain-containing protein, partial [Candidatus Fermentibacteria bacterium]|nr:PD40 domain-containing protein [Candidatus Fermentibacteria bacterium]
MRRRAGKDRPFDGCAAVGRLCQWRGALLGALSAVLMASACSEPTEPPRYFPVETVTTIDHQPAWSPDGRTIAYRHGWNRILLLDMETMERRVLTYGCAPAWSPDGGSIVYVGAEGMQNIYVIELETGAVRKLTNWGKCCDPSWSPDGSRIAFDSWQHIQEYVGGPAQDF